MKCLNCNSELLEGAKFCTTCGTPVKQESAQSDAKLCSKCNAPLLADAKFCTACGATIAVEPTTDTAQQEGELSVVKQKIFWNIRKGEVACHINEAEFVHYDNAQGLIVNDGTTAYVKSGGKILAQIHGGVYDFVDTEELQNILNKREGGMASLLSAGGRFLVNVILGRPVKDRLKDKATKPEQQESLDALIKSLRNREVLSLQLKLDKEFSLVFGNGTVGSNEEFQPMKIRTKLFDVDMGVRAVFHIEDFEAFARYYLVDNRVATTKNLADSLLPTIQNAVQSVMQNCEIDGTNIPQTLLDAVKANIAAQNKDFHGLELDKIAEIVVSNEDLERFRQLSRELYLSEQELSYLQRTNDFRNRLAIETNNQQVAEARSELQLYQGLQEVNKDMLLTEDELDKFYTVLSREKRIRDARNEDEVNAALADIAKTEMLREEDLENLQMAIAERGYNRDKLIRMMQLKDSIEFEKVRVAGEGDIAIESMRKTLELQELAIASRRKVDDYDDERRAKEREMAYADRMRELDADKADMDAQIEQLRKLKEIEREDRRMEQSHEIEMERLHQEELSRKGALTPEQLMAIAASENMNSDAASKFAESFSAGRNAEQMQQANDARIADAHRHEDQMMEIIRQMAQMNSNMATGMMQQNQAQRTEQARQMERQEARIDHITDSALEYATRNNKISNSQPEQRPAQTSAQAVERFCPKCGTAVARNIRFCHHCGADLN